MRFGVLASTGGSVLARAATVPFVRERLAGVVADRPCGALEVAADLGVPGVLVPWTDVDRFGTEADAALEGMGADVTFLFFTRLVGGALLDRHLLNLHPSLLPAFPGLHGVEDALAHGVRVLGTTVHRVDAGMDTGEIVLQTSFPVAADPDPVAVRHQVFVDQCRSLVQLVHWLEEGRLGAAPVRGARFVPALERPEAIGLEVPQPPVCTR